MFGLFRRRPSRSVSATPASLGLESLEARDCPAAPVLSLTLTPGNYHNVTISGTVTDETPANQTVSLGGVVSGSATTDANGHFSATLWANDLGNITATVTDSEDLTGSAVATLQNSAPVIDAFTCSELGGFMFTFSGHVSDEHAAGLTVNFGGVPYSLQYRSAVVDANGNFSLTIRLNGTETDNGTATAQIFSDWWGVGTAESAMTTVTQTI